MQNYNPKIKIFLGLIAAGLLVAGGYFVLRGTQSNQQVQEFRPVETQPFRKGEKVPDVTLVGFDDKTYKLSDFSGKAVVLDFWAAWCPFCVEEMLELQKAQEKYSDQLVMIGVHRTDTENKNTGIKFARQRGVSYLLVTDNNGALYKAAGGFGMPVAIYIDSDGTIVEIKSGPKTKEEIKKRISELVNQVN